VFALCLVAEVLFWARATLVDMMFLAHSPERISVTGASRAAAVRFAFSIASEIKRRDDD